MSIRIFRQRKLISLVEEIKYFYFQLFIFVQTGNLQLVRQLLSAEADVWYKDEQGRTPLHIASQGGFTQIVELLLEYGAPWNVLDNQDRTVGDYALLAGNNETYKTLINAGCRSELILGCAQRYQPRKTSNEDYLKQKLIYEGDRLIDAEGHGVMMGWESPLMSLHAEVICQPSTDENTVGDILNIGFGLGIIDEAIQKYKPRSHTIIEAHPDVYKHMIDLGWDKKPGVRIIFGRWQDVLEKLKTYDGIFFDTYGEYYDDMKDFHEELGDMLNLGGCYSFFNGLVATQPFFHEVYCAIVEMELDEMGFSVNWKKIDINVDEKNWEGIARKYFRLKQYNLPIIKWKET